jgi:hypothetical protein
MTLAIEANGLDVVAICPSKGGKYSPNLYAWLTLRSKKYRAGKSRVFATKEGTIYIGIIDDGYLIGCKLIAVLCNGKKEESWAFGDLGELVEVPDFWARYLAVGRCAIDPEHKMHFVGDDTRWRTAGDHRECLWCGAHSQKLRRWVESVDRSAWETVTANVTAAASLLLNLSADGVSRRQP